MNLTNSYWQCETLCSEGIWGQYLDSNEVVQHELVATGTNETTGELRQPNVHTFAFTALPNGL